MLSRFSRASGPQSGFRFLGKQPCFKAISCSFSTSKQEDEHERKDSINLRVREVCHFSVLNCMTKSAI